MSEGDVGRERRGDTVWHRPTWPFSGRQRLDDLHDPFGVFEDIAELGSVSFELLGTELESGQLGDLGDIDVYRHEPRWYRRPGVGQPLETTDR